VSFKDSFHEFLKERGIDNHLAEYVRLESMRKQRRERIAQLNNLHDFLTPLEEEE
jgi:hypothetical protein